MNYLSKELPVTQIYLFFAKVLSFFVRLIFRKNPRIIERDGIQYEVDLTEGLDLCLFLFGSFQKNVSLIKTIKLPEDAVVLDIGANIGVMSLNYAKRVPRGAVHAFEPTHFAFAKIKKNLELNPELQKNVILNQTFVDSHTSTGPQIEAYASWSLGRRDKRHPMHGGVLQSTKGVGAITLDDYCAGHDLQRIDFIKIDVDGHEFEVFKGARKAITRHRPCILFELGMYLLDEKQLKFLDFADYFRSLDYKMCLSDNIKTEINISNYGRYIPTRWTADVLAIPNEKS